jgi:hypothetical protein
MVFNATFNNISVISWRSVEKPFSNFTIGYYIKIYPAMTAFTDQYSLPNIFGDIGKL